MREKLGESRDEMCRVVRSGGSVDLSGIVSERTNGRARSREPSTPSLLPKRYSR